MTPAGRPERAGGSDGLDTAGTPLAEDVLDALVPLLHPHQPEAEVDGEVMAEFGPGAVLGERALIEDHGKRTATLRAVTKCKVAVAARSDIAPESLAELSESHRKEDEK